MKLVIVTIYISILSLTLFSQHSIVGDFQTEKDIDMISLYALNGVGEDFVSNIKVNKGSFEFNIHDSLPSGLLLLENNQNRSNKLFFIYNKQSIKFTSNKNWSPSETRYTSIENKLFAFYEKELSLAKQKIRMVNSFMRYYPEKDDIYNSVLQSYKIIEKELMYVTDSIHKHYPNSFVSDLIRGSLIFIPDLEIPFEEQKTVHINSFWEDFPFESKQIIRSDVIMANVREYFLLHTDRKTGPQIQNEIFKKAITKLFSNVIKNKNTKFTFLENIHYFFLETGNTEMAYFIDKNYISNSCRADEEFEINQRIKAYEKTQPGNKAPAIEAENLLGEIEKLSEKELKKSYIIIHFWASTCAHCKESIPELKKLYDTYSSKNVGFIGISLDTEIQNWKDFITQNGLDKSAWSHLHEKDRWNSKTARDFGVHATPTYLILNSDWIVKKRPSNLYEINDFLFNNIAKNG